MMFALGSGGVDLVRKRCGTLTFETAGGPPEFSRGNQSLDRRETAFHGLDVAGLQRVAALSTTIFAVAR